MDNFSFNLAKNIETLRKKKNFSQLQIAKLAGVPRSTIANIESGHGNPTLNNLVKISKVLQITIEELLANPKIECQHFTAIQVPIKLKSGGEAKVYKILMDAIPGMEIDKMEINSGYSFTGVPHTRGTKEYFYCEQGKFEILVSGDKFKLSKGEVLIFPGDLNHSYRCYGSRKAIGFSVVAFS